MKRGVAGRPVHLAFAVLAAPLLVALAAVVRHRWYPTGDFAYIELMMRAIPAHAPLVGVAGRFGSIFAQGSHAGPAMLYELFPVYFLLGRNARALLVATVVHHLVAVGCALYLLRRAGGRSLALIGAIGLAVMARAAGADFFVSPWNPWLASTAFLVFLVAVYALALGRWKAAPVALAVGSYCIQTHVSYTVLVSGLLALTIIWFVRSSDGAVVRQALAWSAGVLAVMWALPLWDQLFRTGNLTSLARYFATTKEPTAGSRLAVKAVLTQWNMAGPWVTGSERDVVQMTPSLTGFVLFVAFVGIGLALAVKRRDRTVLTFQAVGLAAAVLGLLSATRIIGELFEYVMRWSWPIAWFLGVGSAWSMWRAAAEHRARIERPIDMARATLLGLALLTPPCLALAIGAVSADAPNGSDGALTAGLATQVAPKLDPDNRYLLRWHDPAGLGAPGAGMVLELERAGIHVGTDDWTKYAVMPFRVYPESTVDAVLWVVTGSASIERFRARGDAELIGRFDARTEPQRLRSEELRATILDELALLGRGDLIEAIDAQYGNAVLLAAGPTLPPALLAAITEYSDLRLEGAVFQVAPGAPLFP